MKTLLEVQFEGWTATPRMPFILSGNAICMATPTYSLLLGLVGCCLGRPVEPEEVRLGFRYTFDDTAEDVETRQRLVNDGGKIKAHAKGTDAHTREFHVNPRLTVWLDRLDWEKHFRYPAGAPALGRSQDLLKIKRVQKVEAEEIPEAKISGCLLPFAGQLNSAGQLVQLAEAYRENAAVGSGRTSTVSRIFLAIPWLDEREEQLARPVAFPNLFRAPSQQVFYLHDWQL
jgi:CRISPR-associated protein Cas5t